MAKRVYVLALLSAFAASLLTAAPSQARDVTADISQISELMKRNGYSVENTGNAEASHIKASRGKDCYGFEVFFYGCTEKTMKDCKSVQFFCAFHPKTKPTLAAMNGYARDNRWGRIYLDKVGDPVIEMDVDLEKGGMSEALFLDNLEDFDAVVGRFGDFVFTGKPSS
jgi:hypothetical protein